MDEEQEERRNKIRRMSQEDEIAIMLQSVRFRKRFKQIIDIIATIIIAGLIIKGEWMNLTYFIVGMILTGFYAVLKGKK